MKKIIYSLLGGLLLLGALSALSATASAPAPQLPRNIAMLKPGEPVGYTTWQITAPPNVVATREELLNAVNYHLSQYETHFDIMASSEISDDMIPRRIIEVEYAFIDGAFNPKVRKMGAIMQISYEVGYSDAGEVMAYYKAGKPINPTNTRAVALHARVEEIKSQILRPEMDEIQIVDALHDFLVDYGYYNAELPDYRNAYGALMSGAANCQGYAESLCMLLTAAKIENRFVWAKSKVSDMGTHGFNKARIDGMWYNIDCTVDDPTPDKKGRIKRDYLMVDDTVSEQRYEWELSRYPAATVTDFNWHYRNGLVANTQQEFKAMVRAAIAQKQPILSLWINDYTGARYSLKWIKEEPGVASCIGSLTAAAKGITPFKTAVYLTFIYDDEPAKDEKPSP